MASSFIHTVSVGDSPQKIAQKYTVSWEAIKNHPDNAFIKEREQRKGYPIYPGDRLTIPSRELPTHWDEFAQNSRNLMTYLWSLVTQHPSYPQGVTLHSLEPPKNAVTSTTLQVYKKTHGRIWSTVQLTTSIESAFDLLLPYLPAGVVMTSGYRSDADQERVINNYYKKHEGDPKVTNVEERRQWLKKEKKLKIAKVGSSPHRTGLAFDLSGAELASIKAAVTCCANEKGEAFPLQSTIEEGNQNCFHVNLKL